ncbi:MAG: hypothetical protein ABIG87_00495 [Patescibacteria group bacterium]
MDKKKIILGVGVILGVVLVWLDQRVEIENLEEIQVRTEKEAGGVYSPKKVYK